MPAYDSSSAGGAAPAMGMGSDDGVGSALGVVRLRAATERDGVGCRTGSRADSDGAAFAVGAASA